MAVDDDIRDMERLSIFQEIEPEALRLLAYSAETRIFRAGEILFRRGDLSDAGYLVLTGSFRVDDGRPDETDAVIPAHSLIGEMALLTETERPVTIVAREPSTTLKIARPVFHRVLATHPRSALRLQDALKRRLATFTARLAWQAARISSR